MNVWVLSAPQLPGTAVNNGFTVPNVAKRRVQRSGGRDDGVDDGEEVAWRWAASLAASLAAEVGAGRNWRLGVKAGQVLASGRRGRRLEGSGRRLGHGRL